MKPKLTQTQLAALATLRRPPEVTLDSLGPNEFQFVEWLLSHELVRYGRTIRSATLVVIVTRKGVDLLESEYYPDET